MSNFIVFEGICTSGKTTTAKHLCDKLGFLYNKGVFSQTDYGELFKSNSGLRDNHSDILYLADLILNTKNFIAPTLDKEITIIQDRYYDSIIAYSQAISNLLKENYDVELIINKMCAKEELIPIKIYFYFFATKDVIMQRLKAEPSIIHDFYIDNPMFLDSVLNNYDKLLKVREMQGAKVLRVDTSSLPVEVVSENIKNVLYL